MATEGEEVPLEGGRTGEQGKGGVPPRTGGRWKEDGTGECIADVILEEGGEKVESVGRRDVGDEMDGGVVVLSQTSKLTCVR